MHPTDCVPFSMNKLAGHAGACASLSESRLSVHCICKSIMPDSMVSRLEGENDPSPTVMGVPGMGVPASALIVAVAV